MTTTLPTAFRRAAVLGVLVTSGCLDDRPTAPSGIDDIPVRLGLQAEVLGAVAGQTVRIRTFYRRNDGTDVTLESTPSEVGVTPGESQTVAVQVRVTRCLADDQREGGDERSCEIGVELSLLDEAGTVIDQYSTPPTQAATPGSSVTIREPITLADIAEVSVASVSALRVGDARTLTATATDASGGQLARTYTWSSDNPSVLSVNATTGAATAVSAGSASVTATTGLKSGSVTVRVIRRVASVTLSPNPAPSLKAAATLDFTVAPKDASGADAGDLADRTITWTATNPSGSTRIATVSSNGTVTGVFPGDADVTASVDGVTSTVRVRVTAGDIRAIPSAAQLLVGATLQLQATAVDVNGLALSGVPLSFSSSRTAVATVSNTGLVTGVAAGEATITVTGGGVSTTVPVTVGSLSLGLTPAVSTMLAGNTLTLAVTGALAPVTWQTSSASVATVSSAGVVTAIYPGRTTITATATTPNGTQRGTATIDVTAATLEIIPDDAVIFEFQTIQFSAVARDTKGTVLTGLPVSWASTDQNYAPINSSGVVNAAYETTATISAFSGGLSATASLRVVTSSENFRPSGSNRGAPAPTRPTRTPPGN